MVDAANAASNAHVCVLFFIKIPSFFYFTYYTIVFFA